MIYLHDYLKIVIIDKLIFRNFLIILYTLDRFICNSIIYIKKYLIYIYSLQKMLKQKVLYNNDETNTWQKRKFYDLLICTLNGMQTDAY